MVFGERKSITGKSNVFVPSEKHKFILNFIHSQLSIINRTFNLKESETSIDNVQVKRYIKIYNWWQDPPKLYNAYFGIIDFSL